MTCLSLGEKKITFYFISIFAKRPLSRTEKRRAFISYIYFIANFLVLCHGLGFHILVAGCMEMDMAVKP